MGELYHPMQTDAIRAKKTTTLTPRQVAKECGFGITHTYRMLAEGTIPSIRVGNRFFVPRVALERWLAACGSPEGHQ